MTPPIHLILAATLGAGAIFAIQPPLPQACEPIELVRFAGQPTTIHVVQEPTFGRSTDDWFQQFDVAQAETETVATDEEPTPRRHRWRRRHGR